MGIESGHRWHIQRRYSSGCTFSLNKDDQKAYEQKENASWKEKVWLVGQFAHRVVCFFVVIFTH